MERYEIEENDDEDWPWCVSDSQRKDDDDQNVIVCICNDKQFADMIVRALNNGPST